MRQLLLPSAILMGLALAVASGVCLSPVWTRKVALDFSNQDRETRQYRSIEAASRDLDSSLQQAHLRMVATSRVALDLADGRISLEEAIDAMRRLARSNPEWYEMLQRNYIAGRLVSPEGEDREVLTCYLYFKVCMFREVARSGFDSSRAAAFTECLARLQNDVPALHMSEKYEFPED